MRDKLFLLAFIVSSPLLVFAQNTGSSFLYNQGQMVVKGQNPDNTILYIKGDFVSGTDATETAKSDITLTNSKTVLTGDFFHNVPEKVSEANVFNIKSDGVFEFRGTAKQQITTSGTEYSNIPDKLTSYINFPTLLINNAKTVVMDEALGAEAKNVKLEKGTLVLTAKRIDSENKGRYYNGEIQASPNNNPVDRSIMAHLLAHSVDYSNIAVENPEDRGFIEVQVAMDPKDSYTWKDGRYGSLVGMGIPFQKMKSDYFMFNYLLTPVTNSFFGPGGKAPEGRSFDMIPGKGYIVANGLRGSDYEFYKASDFDPQNQKDSLGDKRFNNRFQGEYIFNRVAFANRGGEYSNNQEGSYQNGRNTDAYKGEQLNTGDVKVTLSKGYNYLSNPFTTPLNITDLLTASDAKNEDWGVIVGSPSQANKDIYSIVWVMTGSSKGSALYDMRNGNSGKDVLIGGTVDLAKTSNVLQIDVKTDVAKLEGGTYIDDSQPQNSVVNKSRVYIPALQMFAVYSMKDDVELTIPASARVMGRNQFIRSSASEPKDDFIFEVQDLTTQTRDRANVVLRPRAEILSNSNYLSLLKTNGVARENETITKSDPNNLEQGISSQLYTTGTDGRKEVVNFVPYTKNVDSKVTVPLGLNPSTLDQKIIIRGFNLATLSEFDNIILEDKLTGKQVLMTPDTEYETTTKSTDSPDRFVLYFTRGVDGIEDEIDNNTNAKQITSFYANGTLTVSGFDEADFNSVLSIYDIQGRFIYQTKVNDFTMTINQDFQPGVFVVKVNGNRTYVSKFLAK